MPTDDSPVEQRPVELDFGGIIVGDGKIRSVFFFLLGTINLTWSVSTNQR